MARNLGVKIARSKAAKSAKLAAKVAAKSGSGVAAKIGSAALNAGQSIKGTVASGQAGAKMGAAIAKGGAGLGTKVGMAATKLGVNPATLATAAKVAKGVGAVASRVAPYAAGGKVGLAIGAGTLAAYGGYKAHQYVKKKGGLRKMFNSARPSTHAAGKPMQRPVHKLK